MANVQEWPVGDRAWVSGYRSAMTGKNVPPLVLRERERELLEAILEAETPAAELFGSAAELAAGDVAELATADEAVRTSPGGGVQPALREVGGSLIGVGVVAVVLMFVRNGWSVDIDVAHVLVACGVLVVFLGWIIGRAFFSAGRSGAAVAALLVAGVVFAMSIASAVSMGPGTIAARGISIPLLALVVLVPGVLLLVVARRMSHEVLREDWEDDEWLRRFRGGLRSHFVPTVVARGHVVEIQQSLASGRSSAYAEFGHPLVLARELAAADRASRARRWWVSTIAGTGAPLIIAVVIIVNDSWEALTVPAAGFCVLAAAIALSTGWGNRPWASAL